MREVNIIVTGGPATGKSTLIALIGTALAEEGFDINFSASTPAESLELTPQKIATILNERKERVTTLKDRIKIYIREEQAHRG